MGMHTIA